MIYFGITFLQAICVLKKYTINSYLRAKLNRYDNHMHVKLQLFIVLNLFFYDSISFASSCSHQKTATINVSLDFSDSMVPNLDGGWTKRNKLQGVQTDRSTMRELNRTFFKSTDSMEFTDEDALRLESQSGQTQRSAFLVLIEKFATDFRKKNGTDSKVLINISTHGVRCKTASGEIQWGFIIPERRLDLRSSAPQRNDPEYLFNCDDQAFKKLFISAKDLVDSISPDGIIIDTCYAGHFEKNLISINSPHLQKNGFFVLTSSSDFMTTMEEKTQNKKFVGPLFHALKQLVESPEICDLDLDGNGELSQDEVAFYMLGFYVQLAKDEMPVSELLLDFDRVKDRRQHYKDMTSNLGTARTNNHCLLKIPDKFNCTKRSITTTLPGAAPSCMALNSELTEIHKKIINLFPSQANHSLFRYKDDSNSPIAKSFSFDDLKVQSKTPEQRKSNQLEVVAGGSDFSAKNLEPVFSGASKRGVDYAKDQRRKSAVSFFSSYLQRLNDQYIKSCSNNDSGATSQCKKKLSELHELKQNLEKIVMFYKVN